MNYNYEIVTTTKKIPAKIIINTSPEIVPSHWHKDLELTFSYQGSFTSYVNGAIFSIKNKQLILVNSGAVHSIIDYGTNASTTITILLPYSFLKDNYFDIENIEFKLNIGKEKILKD